MCDTGGEEVIANRRGRFKYIFHISKAFTVSGREIARIKRA